MGEGVNFVTLVVAVLGAGGIGAVIREVFSGISKLSSGVALRESKRKVDIITERDRAALGEKRAILRAEIAERNVQTLKDSLSDTRRILMEENGKKLLELPEWPELEDTVTRAELDALIAKEQNL